ncbi:hypothetical protein [Azonexus hydrophilus]|uniref:ASCH domain-containing protein n=1 Tax=Azonexus hydrophilus TaxID=418702 RepID=A0ABZ2XLG3_9RHOO
MKAISIWQPHASLLMSGLHKPYETRSWKPWKNLIGQRIWIHAGKATDDLEEMMEYLCDRADGGPLDHAWEAYCSALKQMGFNHLKEMPRGCLLGTAVLAGFLPTEKMVDPGYFGNFGTGRFAWHFVEHERLETPILFMGKQGFFEVPENVIAGVATV